jgi:hypothetical protein
MSSYIFLCCIHNANQPQVQTHRYPSFATTWTNIALAKFHHSGQFRSLTILRPTSFHKQPASFPFHLKSLSLGSAVASGPAEVARTMCADFHLRQTHFKNYRSSSVFKLVRLSVSQMA